MLRFVESERCSSLSVCIELEEAKECQVFALLSGILVLQYFDELLEEMLAIDNFFEPLVDQGVQAKDLF